MSYFKMTQDWFLKLVSGKSFVPAGLLDLYRYSKNYGSINFKVEKSEDGSTLIAISTNFRYGSIVTSGRDEEELDKNIKDAILTSFEVPSSYASEAKVENISNAQKVYALA